MFNMKKRYRNKIIIIIIIIIIINSHCPVPHYTTQTVAPKCKVHAATITLIWSRYFEESESLSFILCLLVKTYLRIRNQLIPAQP